MRSLGFGAVGGREGGRLGTRRPLAHTALSDACTASAPHKLDVSSGCRWVGKVGTAVNARGSEREGKGSG